MSNPVMPSGAPLVHIEDAKALKRMGVPLNTPVEHRHFARESTKHWIALWGDLTTFCLQMYDYQKEPTEKGLAAWKRVLRQMGRRAEKLVAHANALEDRHEAALLLSFVENKVAPFYDGWVEVFEALDGGETIQIRPITEWEWNPLQGAGS